MILLSPDAVEDVERLREFPDLGMPTENSDIRQIVVTHRRAMRSG